MRSSILSTMPRRYVPSSYILVAHGAESAAVLLEHCEAAAAAAGFRRLEMGATLTGVPLISPEGTSKASAARFRSFPACFSPSSTWKSIYNCNLFQTPLPRELPRRPGSSQLPRFGPLSRIGFGTC